MVTMQNVILAPPKLRAQGPDEVRFLHQGSGRMDHAGAKRIRLHVHRSRLLEDTIKSPISVYFLFPRMREHAEEPILYSAAVEVFNDVEDFQNCSQTRD
jgi:hypothetical protein